MGRWRNIDGRGHKRQEEDKKSKERSPAAPGIERRGVVNGWDTEELHNENQDDPEIPTLPETKEPKQEKNSSHAERRVAAKTGAGGAEGGGNQNERGGSGW